MKPEAGVTEINLYGSVTLLSTILSDEMILYTKTRKFHWNVSGESFMELHKLFENQYTVLEEIIDLVAERINKSGSKTIGTMKEFSNLSRLKESPGKYPSQKEMIEELLEDHETVIKRIRKDVETSDKKNQDAGTADLLTEILQQHETVARALRRYLN